MPDSMPSPAPSAAPVNPQAKQIFALLAYLPPFLFILTMLKKGGDLFHVFHAKNSVGFLIVFVVYSIVVQILLRVLVFLPVGIFNLVGLILNLVSLAILLLVLFAAYRAWKGEQWNIPLVTAIGQRVPLEKWFKKGGVESMAISPNSSPAPVVPAAPVAAPSAPSVPPVPAEPAPTSPVEPSPPMPPPASTPLPAEPMSPTPPPSMTPPAPIPPAPTAPSSIPPQA